MQTKHHSTTIIKTTDLEHHPSTTVVDNFRSLGTFTVMMEQSLMMSARDVVEVVMC